MTRALTVSAALIAGALVGERIARRRYERQQIDGTRVATEPLRAVCGHHVARGDVMVLGTDHYIYCSRACAAARRNSWAMAA